VKSLHESSQAQAKNIKFRGKCRYLFLNIRANLKIIQQYRPGNPATAQECKMATRNEVWTGSDISLTIFQRFMDYITSNFQYENFIFQGVREQV
jgi:hypothetical protein